MSPEGSRHGPQAADGLRRQLGLWDATAIFVGIILGSGIFLAPSTVAAAAPGRLPAVGQWIVGGLVAAWTKLSLNPVRRQATVAVPPELTAIVGKLALPAVVETGPSTLKLPPEGRNPASITRFEPWLRCHAATAFPAASMPITGSAAFSPDSETCAGGPKKVSPPGRAADWMIKSSPSKYDQTATAVPEGSIAIRDPAETCPLDHRGKTRLVRETGDRFDQVAVGLAVAGHQPPEGGDDVERVELVEPIETGHVDRRELKAQEAPAGLKDAERLGLVADIPLRRHQISQPQRQAVDENRGFLVGATANGRGERDRFLDRRPASTTRAVCGYARRHLVVAGRRSRDIDRPPTAPR